MRRVTLFEQEAGQIILQHQPPNTNIGPNTNIIDKLIEFAENPVADVDVTKNIESQEEIDFGQAQPNADRKSFLD